MRVTKLISTSNLQKQENIMTFKNVKIFTFLIFLLFFIFKCITFSCFYKLKSDIKQKYKKKSFFVDSNAAYAWIFFNAFLFLFNEALNLSLNVVLRTEYRLFISLIVISLFLF